MSDRPKGPVYRLGPDVLGVLAACCLVLIPFFSIAFAGKTLSTSAEVPGANGFHPPTGQAPTAVVDRYRLDKGASAWAFEPWVEASHRILRDGDLPLWNPYQAAGAPHAANGQSGVLDPFLLPVNLRPTPLVWDMTFIAAFLAGSVAMYLFLRNIGLVPLAAVTGSAAFILSGYFLLYSNDHFFRAYLYLPILFLLVDRTVATTKLWSVVVLGITIAGSILVGMPEASLMVLAASSAYALGRILSGDGTNRLVAAARLGAGGLLGLAFASPFLFPLAEYVPLSFSLHEPSSGSGLIADPGRLLLSWIVPFFDGPPLASASTGSLTGTRSWVGAAVSVLALVALTASPKVRRQYRVAVMTVIAVVVLMKVYGWWPAQWLGRLPLAERTNFPAFAVPIAAFALAALAGVGVQVLWEGAVRRPRLALIMVPAALGMVLLAMANEGALRAGAHLAMARQFALAFTAALAVCSLAFAVPRRAAAVLAASVVVTELAVLAPRGIYAARADPFRSPAWLDSLPRASSDRVFGLHGRLFPNTAAAFGVQDVRALDALYVNRYVEYVRAFVEPEFESRFVGGPYAQTAEKTNAHYVDNPMFDLLGVRYILTDGTPPTDSFLDRVFQSVVPDAALRRDTFVVGSDRRPVLFAHPPREISIPVTKANARGVSFSYTVDPAAFADATSDGVEFSVDGITVGGKRHRLWSDEYVPRSDPLRPEWRSANVRLPGAAGDLTSVVLRTMPRRNTSSDWAGWTEVRVVGPDGMPVGEQKDNLFPLVGQSDGTTVFESTSRLPRALLATRVQTVPDWKSALRFFADAGGRRADGAIDVRPFDPSLEAVLESEDQLPPGSEKCPERDRSTAQITSYRSRNVTVKTSSPCPALLVLTDTFYPGWKAAVDGKAVDIHAANILFRGVFVPAGESTVTFRYEPRSFTLGLATASLAALTCSAVGTWRAVQRQRRRRRPKYGSNLGPDGMAGAVPQ